MYDGLVASISATITKIAEKCDVSTYFRLDAAGQLSFSAVLSPPPAAVPLGTQIYPEHQLSAAERTAIIDSHAMLHKSHGVNLTLPV